jgi:hypothetical protein
MRYQYTNIKILAVILLAGFVLSGIVFISYAAEPQCANPVSGGICPPGFRTAKSGEPCEFCIKEEVKTEQKEELKTEQPQYVWPTNGICPSGYEKDYTLDTAKEVCKLPGLPKPGTYEVKVSTETVKTDDYNCMSIGFSADKDGKCPESTNRIECPQDPNKYRCIQKIKLTQQKVRKWGGVIVKIPCQPIFGGTCPEPGTPAGYIARLYQFGLMIAGLVAFGAIVFGALKYILSAGNIASQQDARDQITQAILGLVLLFGAYLILYTINPQLVSLRNPQVEPIKVEELTKYAGELVDEGLQEVKTTPGAKDPNCNLAMSFDLIAPEIKAGLSKESKTLIESGQKSYCLPGGCKEGSERVDGICVCQAGYEPDPKDGRCTKACQEGYKIDPKTSLCVPK